MTSMRAPVLLSLVLCVSPTAAADLPPPVKRDVDFVRDVQPLLAKHCWKCHGSKRQVSGLGLHRRSQAFSADSGPVIVPGKSADSRLIRYVSAVPENSRMPPEGQGEPLTAEQIGILRAWIDQGAKWPANADTTTPSDHWAYRKPVRPALPAIRNPQSATRNPIDRFILARLEKEGLTPAREEERAVLLRRLSLDLIGLPPTPAEVDAFLADTSPNAYERQVERLLASPRYGERWARPWLDLARYADTNGYEKDRPRTMWLWRDWVIRALNDDMPFDRFTIEQLAGDLLLGTTPWQRVATGFHRNSMLNDEGGIDPEEFRVVAVKDRVDTTATVWLGTTLECAQCHSHKYDPFTQTEYYQFYAFFNHTMDSGVGNGPELAVATPEQQDRMDRIHAEIRALEKSLTQRGKDFEQAREAWERELAAKPLPEKPTKEGLYVHYPLKGGKGAKIEDASGLGRSALFKGGRGALWTATAMRFDGTGGVVDAGGLGDFEKDRGFSYGCWVKPETTTGCLISRMDDQSAYRGWDLFLTEGHFEVHLVNLWPQDALKVRTTRTFPAGVWHHVFVTYDGSSKASGMTIFVDGRAEALTVESDRLQGSIRTSVSLKLGRRHVTGPFTGYMTDVRIYDRHLHGEEIKLLAAQHPILEIVRIPAEKRTEAEKADLASFFETIHADTVKIRQEIVQKQDELRAYTPVTTMVMQELSRPRETHVQGRGNFRQKGRPVEPDVPAVLHPFPAGASRNRLGLAQWLVHPDNPLVGRVVVNRAWEAFFGRYLVQTPEDFGTQGDRPTHPELLDWLAVELVESGWSMKNLHRLIVTSATYRQSSRVTRDLLSRDPYNLLLARGPRQRLEYESLRDLALACGGRLAGRIGGPSVMPPQPPGVWENSFGFYDLPDFRWKPATGSDRYRRGLYTFLRRTAMYPTYLLFDGVSRDVCTVRRSRTNTPLQALAALNDPTFVEAAGGLARRVLAEGGSSVEERARHAFRLCVSRVPEADEVTLVESLYRKALARYQKDAPGATQLVWHCRVQGGQEKMEELAAWIVVANVLLNLDETVNK
jgi:hypothetical protein